MHIPVVSQIYIYCYIYVEIIDCSMDNLFGATTITFHGPVASVKRASGKGPRWLLNL